MVMTDYKKYAEDLLQDLYKSVDEYRQLSGIVIQLLDNINEDKDGSYFICAENKDIIDKLRGLVK